MRTPKRFNVEINGRLRHFETFEAAVKFANEYARRYNVFLGIEKTAPVLTFN